MVTVGLLVRLEAKPGKEAEVESFLARDRASICNAQESDQRFSSSLVTFLVIPESQAIGKVVKQQKVRKAQTFSPNVCGKLKKIPKPPVFVL